MCYQAVTADNQAKAGAANGVETVLKVLSVYADSPNVCYTGCAALGAMTASNCKKKEHWTTL